MPISEETEGKGNKIDSLVVELVSIVPNVAMHSELIS